MKTGSKLAVLILFISASGYKSQNYKIGYEYSIKRGDSIKKQVTILAIKDRDSYFFGNNSYIADSIINDRMKASKDGSMISFKNLPSDFIVYYLKKDITSNSITYYSNEFPRNMEYQEDVTFKWNIKNEFIDIFGYRCQKATLSMYGRKWIAWFSPEIPINNGPYKFFGLPGLIMNISDEEKNHSFKIISFQNQSVDINFIYDDKYIKTTKSKYLAYRKQYKKDPFMFIKTLIKSTGINSIKGKNGQDVNFTDLVKMREKEALEEYKFDNQIEN
ncbi:GLPGLI family protein [Elizabethkingia meningoseptica]|uniref:GLPGLI family protein n=1 Tax=Elizabethkingia meningoseptica TaxID=238 RepID=UPI00389196D7